MKYSVEQIQQNLRDIFSILRQYDWLVDSYMLDFYVDDHWQKMPPAWRRCFEDVEPSRLAPLLSSTPSTVVWPLSMLAIQALVAKLSIPRVENKTPLAERLPLSRIYTEPKIRNLVAKKSIKLKKRHEIEEMSGTTAQIAKDLGIEHIIDFGSGLGHLSRMLAYGYGLRVCCLEQQSVLSDQATDLDANLERVAVKLLSPEHLPDFERPVHLNLCLTSETDLHDLVDRVKRAFNVPAHLESNFTFGIVGLHPCGNLAAILTNFFLQCPQAKFVNLVGCCYMKLSCASPGDTEAFRGYPMSEFITSGVPIGTQLSYEAREIACHAIEQYEFRLRAANYENLRVHSFRAAIEKIICRHWPDLRHSGLRSIKHLTTFEAYCGDAVSRLGIEIPMEDVLAEETTRDLANWKRIVMFYALRLMLAPLVESAILLDRILFLLEQGCDTSIRAIFDPDLSPRNHILTSMKTA